MELIRTRRVKENVLFYFVLIDVLLLPYVRFLHISISMVPLIFWYVKKIYSIERSRLFNLLVAIMLLAIISVGAGALIYPQYLRDNIIYLVTMVFCILYYYFFYYYMSRYKINIKKILITFMIFSMLLAFLWVLRPQLYFNLRSYWTMSGKVIEFRNASWNRFTFLQSDPNSVGAILCSMMLYLFIYEREMKSWERICISIIVSISVIISISTTGIVIYAISLLIYFWAIKWYKFKGKVNAKGLFVLLCLLAVTLMLLAFLVNKENFGKGFFQLAIGRIGTNIRGGTMSGRTLIWKEIIHGFDWHKYLFIGRGNILVNRYGVVNKAHNGHFHLILSYGLFGYIIFMYLFFRKPKKTSWKMYIPMVPLFLLFSVNTLVIDYRANLALSVVAAAYQTGVKKANKI